jgi:DNA-binding transcriptional LysR family regulator
LFPNVEVRHLHAVIVLAEELNFTRAADRLHITQPALSKQITELEKHLGYRLFVRDKKRVVELTDAGRTFVQEARSALLHTERAVQLSRAINEGSESVLTVGRSPYADPAWISAILATRLPLFPKLRVRLRSHFAPDLVRSVLAGELDFAIVTAPPKDGQITAVPFARAPLYAALPDTHRAAHKEPLVLQDLAKDHWILFAKHVNPLAHDAIMELAQREAINPKDPHHIMVAHEAIHLVSEQMGVAFLTKASAVRIHVEGVVFRPLADESLWFDTCVVMRAEDRSRLVNEFARSFLRRYQPPPPKQMELAISA